MAIKFTDEQIQEIERLALINCNSNTIAEATGIAVTTLNRRFGRKLRHWWAKYRVNLRQGQEDLRAVSPQLAIFLGKNELNQTDKQTIATETIESKPKTAKDLRAAKAAAEAYNRELSRGDDNPTIVPIIGQKGA